MAMEEEQSVVLGTGATDIEMDEAAPITPGDRTQKSLATLTIGLQPVLNAALWENHVPVISELVFKADNEVLGDVTLG